MTDVRRHRRAHAQPRPRSAGSATTRSTTTPCSPLLDLAAHATTGRRRNGARSSSSATPTSATSSRARYRQGWSIYKRILRSRWSDDALLEDRQWESDHFEDVPVLVVACLPGRRPLFPAIGAAAFYGAAFPAVQNLLLAAAARGLGASATTLPLWSVWEARRTLGLPRKRHPGVRGRPGVAARRPVGAARGARTRHPSSAMSSTSTGGATSPFAPGATPARSETA